MLFCDYLSIADFGPSLFLLIARGFKEGSKYETLHNKKSINGNSVTADNFIYMLYVY